MESFDEASEAISVGSAGDCEPRYLKLSFVKRPRMDDFPRDEEGPGDGDSLVRVSLGVVWKFTLLGLGLGVGGMFIEMESSMVREGMSRTRLGRFL